MCDCVMHKLCTVDSMVGGALCSGYWTQIKLLQQCGSSRGVGNLFLSPCLDISLLAPALLLSRQQQQLYVAGGDGCAAGNARAGEVCCSIDSKQLHLPLSKLVVMRNPCESFCNR